MSKVMFIAQFPPPIHGLSKAVETLYESPLKSEFEFDKINITDNKAFLKSAWSLLWSKADLYYFTISQTKGGNIRDLILFRILKAKKANTVIHLHGGYYRTLIEEHCGNLQRKLNYKYLKAISGAIVLGKSLEYIFKGLVNESKIYTVANCVDDQYLLPAGGIKEKLLDISQSGKIKVLYLSNFIEAKGYKEVLQMAQFAKNSSAPFEFHFAGKFFESADEAFFNSFVDSNSLHDYVHYHGVVSGQLKNDLLESCHVFVLLTRYPNEGQPISILEAMGNGMAVITTNHAGIPDISVDRVNGLVVDKNNIDVPKVYQFLEELNADRTKLANFASTNYALATTNYTEQQYLDNMANIFRKLT